MELTEPAMRHRSSRASWRAAALALVAMLLAGCAIGPDIRTDYNHANDFSQYRTFAFVPRVGTDRQGYESLTTQYLKDAAQREMTARGYTYAPRNPDLLLNFNMQLRRKSSAAPRRCRRPATWATTPIAAASTAVARLRLLQRYLHYTEGTLNIDIVDAAKNQLVWEGVAQGDASQTDPQTNQRRSTRWLA
jgi:hypothetical protein